MKIADEVMRGPNRSQYHDVDWNKICLDNEWDVRVAISPEVGGAGWVGEYTSEVRI
jgi:hypothetical protein